MKSKLLILLLLASLLSAVTNAQEEPKPKFKDRLFTGGGLGLQFGTVTLVNISPILGYRFNERLSSGVGITYIYLNYRDYDYSTSIYGGNIFTRFNIVEQIFLHSEFEILNLDAYVDNEFKRVNASGFLVGGGYRALIGGKSFMTLMLLWDLIEDRNYPYRNPIIRGGIAIGL